LAEAGTKDDIFFSVSFSISCYGRKVIGDVESAPVPLKEHGRRDFQQYGRLHVEAPCSCCRSLFFADSPSRPTCYEPCMYARGVEAGEERFQGLVLLIRWGCRWQCGKFRSGVPIDKAKLGGKLMTCMLLGRLDRTD
jgi:hypothetical protein